MTENYNFQNIRSFDLEQSVQLSLFVAIILTIPMHYVTCVKMCGYHVDQSWKDIVILEFLLLIILTSYNVYRIWINECDPACILIPSLAEFSKCARGF